MLLEATRVNWELPDTILIEHFKQFLKINRPANYDDDQYKSFLKKCYRKPDFNEWQRLGILPFLDLTCWASESALVIPYRVMADAIYPPGEGGEETVRKTTAPLAEMLMSEEALDALAHQAALEIAESNSN